MLLYLASRALNRADRRQSIFWLRIGRWFLDVEAEIAGVSIERDRAERQTHPRGKQDELTDYDRAVMRQRAREARRREPPQSIPHIEYRT